MNVSRALRRSLLAFAPLALLAGSSFAQGLNWTAVMFGVTTMSPMAMQEATFGPPQVVATAVEAANSVYATDLDGDGDVDALSVSQGGDWISWYENQGSGVFGSQQVITTDVNGPYQIYCCDLDGDEDPDVLSASTQDGKIAWYENLGGGAFGAQQVIDIQGLAFSVYATDLDGDGDADVMSASEGSASFFWYENLGNAIFGPPQVLATQSYARMVRAADLDGDGDADILTASHLGGGNGVGWVENLGEGTFGPLQIIGGSSWVTSVEGADLDHDGDMDILATAAYDGAVWFENLGGQSFGPKQDLGSNTSYCYVAHAAEIDQSLGVDVVVPDAWGGRVDWYANQSEGSFSAGELIGTLSAPYAVHAADMNGDSALDILIGGSNDLVWYENLLEPVAPTILSAWPSQAIFHERIFVTIATQNFDTLGQTSVLFGTSPASNVVWLSENELFCLSPPGNQGDVVDITVIQGEKTATLTDAFSYIGISLANADKSMGNVDGGTMVTVEAQYATTAGDTTVTMNGLAAHVVDVTPTTITFETAAAVEVTAAPVDITVSCSNGTDSLTGVFTYTPSLSVHIQGDDTAGRANLGWQTDPEVTDLQLIAVWVGNMNVPLDPGLQLSGFSGLLQQFPLLFLLKGFPASQNNVSFPFGPVDPSLADITFHLQAFVTGEGGPSGSFTNEAPFVIPSSL